jgi:glucose-1-phosphate cytidylyltransferase
VLQGKLKNFFKKNKISQKADLFMKLVILAGGLGSRISEESIIKPKPLIEIGSKPIIWHVMKYYACFGVKEFIICCGYKGYLIKEYFANYFLHTSDVTINFATNKTKVLKKSNDKWIVTLVDTGETTQTGGRIKKIKKYIGKDENFFMTYSDGLSNINIYEELKFHKKNNTIATLASVRPPGRFGSLVKKNGTVEKFSEKPQGDGSWINAGFFILNKKIFNYIDGDETVWEQEPLKSLVKINQLSAFEHNGFWQPMDTLREKNLLEKLWSDGNAPWKIWKSDQA